MKTFKQTAKSLYDQYENFYNENTTLAITAAVATAVVTVVAAFVFPPLAFAMLATLAIAGTGHFLADMYNYFAPAGEAAPPATATNESAPKADAEANTTESPANENSHAKMAEKLGTPVVSAAVTPVVTPAGSKSATPVVTPAGSRAPTPVVTPEAEEPELQNPDLRPASGMSVNL